jgi:two-component system chemotaxis response regulator CheB
MRKLIRSILERDERLEIVAEAGDASQARDAVNLHKPDVMTLDVEMPNMSGVEFLDKLMRHRPMPVVMVSTLTQKGSAIAVEALSIGAVECVEKPKLGGGLENFKCLAETVVLAAQARVTQRSAPVSKPKISSSGNFKRMCLIGGSTGAVDAIEQILRRFPEDCPATLITQHMPEAFLASFAARLNQVVAPKVSLAQHGQVIEQGEVLIAPGGAYHLNLKARPSTGFTVQLVEGPSVSGHRPSVDSMFSSAKNVAHHVVAGILTGMGGDGAAGMKQLRDYGARTIGQTKETCVVFGMPRVAGELDAVEQWADLDDFAARLLKLAHVPVGGSA